MSNQAEIGSVFWLGFSFMAILGLIFSLAVSLGTAVGVFFVIIGFVAIISLWICLYDAVKNDD
jgi:hypothetical protein